MSERQTIEHVSIAASAGSGKTYKLTHRFIRLLTLGVEPGRILALTFSRKAAGEIFEALIKHLCNAIVDPDSRANTCREIGAECEPQVFTDCLGRLLDNLHRLRIGTLDSFIIGILKIFPMELGVAANLRMMDESGWEGQDMRRELLSKFFPPSALSETERKTFLANYEKLSDGQQKRVFATLSETVFDWHERYLLNASPSAWGDPATIWPAGNRWSRADQDLERAKRILLEWNSENVPQGKNYSEYIPELTEQIDGQSRYCRIGSRKRIDYFLDKIDDVPALFELNSLEIKLGRKTFHIEGEAFQALLTIIRHAIATNMRWLLEKTTGIYGLISRYEAAYRSAIERTGSMSFMDSQLLLDPESSRFSGTVLHSGSRGSGQDRLEIDFRLDGAIDHWLLDEFQDTSDVQWGCIKSLVDEVVMDSEGRRSFFYVGDVKQAIYSWRRGNPDLFEQIRAGYGGALSSETLSKSWRSCPAVIDAVNRVFGDLESEQLPDATLSKWRGIWSKHATEKKGLSGSVDLVQALEENCGDSSKDARQIARQEAVASLISELKPTERGLSTAILVRQNEQIGGIVDTLRQRCADVPVVHEGPAEILDEPAAALLLNIIRFAAHPYDRAARGHIEMSPLFTRIAGELDLRDFSLKTLEQLQEQGVHSYLLLMIEELQQAGSISAYERWRLEGLERAAAEFDENNSPDPDNFIRFAESYKYRHPSSTHSVRVMTVHQSKGLEFDVVILPELEGGRPIDRVNRFDFLEGVSKDSSRPAWYLSLTSRKIAECDQRLAEAAAVADAKQSFENLCLLYVAMTRAIRGLYIVTSDLKSRRKIFNYAAFLQERIDLDSIEPFRCDFAGQLHSYDRYHIAGAPDWYADLPSAPSVQQHEEAVSIPHGYHKCGSTRTRPVQITPSDDDQRGLAVVDHLSKRKRSLVFGSAIHELFSRMSWIEDADPENVAEEWKNDSVLEARLKSKVADQFLKNMRDPQVRAIFEKKDSNAELWIEKGFESLRGNDWISGVFDRVAVHKDNSDQAIRAELIEFKSNRIDSAGPSDQLLRKHSNQIEEYRRVLSELLGLGRDSIKALLLYTVGSRIIEL